VVSDVGFSSEPDWEGLDTEPLASAMQAVATERQGCVQGVAVGVTIPSTITPQRGKSLSSQRWRQIEELYHSACEHGPAVLDGVDPAIRGEVEKLLSHTSEDGNKLLDQRASELMIDLKGPRSRPARV
jgi:hypothetical protein